MNKVGLSLAICLYIMGIFGLADSALAQTSGFPSEKPEKGNFNRPGSGEICDVSPPGFCWWRAGERAQVNYRLRIFNVNQNEVYTSSITDEPACIPDKVLPSGSYIWIVEALSASGEIIATRPASTFVIAENAVQLPWIDAAKLLEQVPHEHPRLLFPKDKLAQLRQMLDSDLKIEFISLKKAADEALSIPLVKMPDFDKYTSKKEYATKRTAYREAFHEVGNAYQGGVVPLALMYVLTDEKQYGAAAKAHIMNLISWGTDGVMSVQDPRFDEVGLGIARSLPQGYDWCYDLFSKKERIAVESFMIELGNKLLERMKTRDFLNNPSESHDGRVPGYLLEFAIALAEHPEAVAWMDYGLKATLTVFPHWAGQDGGWAEGVVYAMTYNDRFITPLQSLYISTGFDLWQKPFFRKFPYFLTYCISPVGEITPFGDSEDKGIAGRADKLRSMLLFYASRNNDPGLRWWVDLFDESEADSGMDGSTAIRDMILPDIVIPKKPENMPPDRAFYGIGWTALHSDLTNPDEDLMVLLKSSPFGPISHSHLDQNSFTILKGGKALAISAGARYPQHGSPFHTEYSRLTLAHNALLINGNGQIDRNENANGRLIDFKSLAHIGYTAGEAQNAYGPLVDRYIRHIVLIRPSLILILDDLELTEPAQVDWLMHGFEKFDIREQHQSFISVRDNIRMNVQLVTSEGFDFSQTDEWLIEPKKGYPMVTTDPPAKQWHLTAKRLKKSNRVRIAAIMSVDCEDDLSAVNVKLDSELLDIDASFPDVGQVNVTVNLGTEFSDAHPLITINYKPQAGKPEILTIP